MSISSSRDASNSSYADATSPARSVSSDVSDREARSDSASARAISPWLRLKIGSGALKNRPSRLPRPLTPCWRRYFGSERVVDLALRHLQSQIGLRARLLALRGQDVRA